MIDLSGKYDKSNLLGGGDVQVWRGTDRARGTPVLLHTFTGNPKVLSLAVEYLLRRPASSPLLDIGEWDGATCLVTVSELDMLDVSAWLESAIAVGPAATPPPPESPRVTTGPVPISRADSGPVQKPVPQGPGEFTRAFQIPSSNVAPQPLPDPLAGSGPTRSAAGPGEFTLLFQLPWQAPNRETSKAPETALPPSPPGIHPPAAPSAGEFTRLFKAQPNDNSPRDFPVSSGATPQAFPSAELPEAPVAPKLNIVSGPVTVPERSAPPAPKGPGEYTRIILTPSMQAPPQASAPPPPSPAFAQAVQLPTPVIVTPTIPSAPAPPSFPAAVAPPLQASIPIPQAPSLQVPAPAAPQPGLSPVVLLLGGLVLVALVLVLVFALRR